MADWDVNAIGYVNSSIHENWRLAFTEYHHFTVTIAPITGDLIPLLVLLDANGNELAHSIGTLTSAQAIGSYTIQVQPQTGSGFYFIMLQDILQTQPTTAIVLTPASMYAGEMTSATVSLSQVPADGYTSVEFTCTYDPGLVQVSDIVIADLFGADPVTAINGPLNGRFIVAIAGSQSHKTTTSGTDTSQSKNHPSNEDHDFQMIGHVIGWIGNRYKTLRLSLYNMDPL
jgi:hypothetical protein